MSVYVNTALGKGLAQESGTREPRRIRLFKPDVDKLKARNDVEGLIKALNDASAEVRIKVAYALANMGDPRAVDGLIECLVDTNGSV